MRVLNITTVGMTMRFFINYIKALEENGHTVDIACNNSNNDIPEFFEKNGNKQFQISCSRSPFSFGNFKAIKEIKKIVEAGDYDIVHCHTPIAAACTRIACRKARKKGVKVIYTAHGFHFYKGAPKQNWAIFYPIEKFCARYTDVLITINKEDYALAQKKIKVKQIEYVPGVGIDVSKFADCVVDKSAKRKELNLPNDAFLMLSVGELNKNKNHEAVIRALARVENKNLYYIIAGEGDLRDYLLNLADELGVKERVKLLGQRNDVKELYKTADLYLHPSYREGLPVAVVEALASGIPIVCTNIRGNSDVVRDGINGILVGANDVDGFKNAIVKIMNDSGNIAKTNSEDAKVFGVLAVNERMFDIYFGQEN